MSDAKTTVVHTDLTARKTTDWGSLAWAVSAEAGNSRSMTFGRVCINAGCENPQHRHDNCEELLYLLCGELDHFAEDVGVLAMKGGDVIVIPAGIVHNARCTGKADAEMIVIYSSPQRHFQTV